MSVPALTSGSSSGLSPDLSAARAPQPTARMRETAQAFEASFLAQMLRPMFEGLSADGPFGGGQAEGQWRSFLVDAMAQQTARAGGVGLADHVLAEMLRMQETPS